jgi:DNA-binding YbaB/EbfC family protein
VTAEGPDLGGLLSQMQQLQQQLMDAQEAAASKVVEGSAGGGVVRVSVSGDLDFREVHIDPSVVDPADVDMLQDLILAAVRDAVARVNEANKQAMGPLGLGGGLEGLLGGG